MDYPKSELQCAGSCLTEANCLGFIYNQGLHGCRFIECSNLGTSSSNNFSAMLAYMPPSTHLLARGKSAKMSSFFPYQNSPVYADAAVDGVYSAQFGEPPMVHTEREVNPWWRVDLFSPHCVMAVRIFNRKDAFDPFGMVKDRLRDAIVSVSEIEDELFNFQGEVVCGSFSGKLHDDDTLIECKQPIRGRFVQVMLQAQTYLHVYEIEVNGI